MQIEDEDKKVDTQTARADEKSGTDEKIDQAFGNGEDEEKTQKQDNKESDSKSGTDKTDAEDKDEGSKANEQTATKSKNGITKNADGSLTFESQEKLEEFANKMFAKGAKKEETLKKAEQEEAKTDSADDTQENQQLSADYILSKIGMAMAIKEVNPSKLARASRLVDQSKILVNGVIDDAKLQEEIDAVIAEFPEVKGTNAEEIQKGFKFGSEGSNKQENLEEDQIASIFGNKKD